MYEDFMRNGISPLELVIASSTIRQVRKALENNARLREGAADELDQLIRDAEELRRTFHAREAPHAA